MKKISINSPEAPAAIGPYSHANMAGDLIFVSGQLPIRAGELVADDPADAARAAMEKIGAILKEAGSDFDHVLRCTVYLTDLSNFAAVNEVYAEFFSENYPARVCFEVSGLPKGALVEIDAIAVKA